MAGAIVHTVILNWRTAPMTLRAAAAALRAMEGIDGGITIVDNASGDGSFETLSAEAQARGWTDGGRVQVLQSGRNGGFGVGNNFGIRAGLKDGRRADYIYILNSDAFPAPDAIRRLLDHLQATPRAGLAGSYIHGTDGVPHATAFRFPSILSELEGAASTGPISRLLRRHVVPLGVPEETRRVDWLAGASLMMRAEVFEATGGFDERFFLYFEETDLCRRARALGYETHYVRDSEVAHVGSASTGMKEWVRTPGYWFASRLYYFAKNHGRAYAAAATLAHVLGGLIWRLRMVLQRKPRIDPPHFLRDLVVHDLGAALRGLRSDRSLPAPATRPTEEPSQ